jgi:E3 ubiquitin-protein ligase TRIP12
LLAAGGVADFKFVFPGTEYELILHGRTISATQFSSKSFVAKVLDAMICKNLAAEFRRGFNRVLPWRAMSVFTGDEIASLFKGNELTKFTLQELQTGVRPAHGYEMDSPQIQCLFAVLLELDENDIKDFLQFTTGARLLPFGGFAALGLTVAKASDKGIDALLTVMTCSRYLNLPAYPTLQTMRAKLRQAISDGRNSFDKT